MKDAGFSLIELLVAMAVTVTLCAAVFSVVDPAHGAFLAQPEIADMQQRLRVGSYTLLSELASAGAGAAAGTDVGSLAALLPPLLPYRLGPASADPPGTFKPDTITVLSVPPLAVQTTIAQAISTDVTTAIINGIAGCPMAGSARDPACGFTAGATALVSDASGAIDFFSVASVSGSTLSLRHIRGALAHVYDVNSRIVPIRTPTYYLKTDAASQTYQLTRYNGAASEAAVVDNVVALSFDYYGTPQSGDPRSQVHIVPGELVDGPWLPDGTNVNRYDADLRRVRRVVVHLRVQSGVAALRGPASALFAHGGTATAATRLVPDLEIQLDAAPQNVNVLP